MNLGMDHGVSSFDDVVTYADDNDVPRHFAAVALNSPLISNVKVWPDIIEHQSATKSKSPNLTQDDRTDLLNRIAVNLGDYIQFPRSTIFLHGLACISSIINKSFKIDYSFGEITPGIYAVTSQPPSTGKSAVNNFFLTPILIGYKKINDIHKDERERLQREVKRIDRDLDSGKKDERDEDELIDMRASKMERLEQIPEYKPVTSNATVEALEGIAKQNSGMYNVISAEADGLNVLVGSAYGDSNSKQNIEIILKAWDGEFFTSDRVSREGFNGHVRAVIAVLAQDDTIDTMLSAGESGRGLTERFLMLSEDSFLGRRDHLKKRYFDKSLRNQYESLVNNLLVESDVTLNFSAEAESIINSYKQGIEPLMMNGGKYSDNMATGFIGKADKHLRKIAATLHCIDNWQDGGSRSRTVNDDYVIWAIYLFDQLSTTFINSADFMGYAGEKSEIDKMIQVFSGFAEKGKIKITTTQLRDKIRNVKPFRGSRDIASKIKDKLIPMMAELNYCVIHGQTIYINPRLK